LAALLIHICVELGLGGIFLTKQRRKWMRILVLALLAGAVVYVLFSSLTLGKEKTLKINETAPNFALTDLDGVKHVLDDYKGQGVFLNFWGTWCKPCEYEMPYMQSQYEVFKDKGVQVLAVNVNESDFVVKNFVERHDLTFPVVIDKDNQVQHQYLIGSLPATFLIDKNGKVVDSTTGSLTEEKIQKMMEKIQP
jgi:peroxiredoxin